MAKTAVYNTTVRWKGEHWGHIVMGNGPEMDFSAPPDAQGHPPECLPRKMHLWQPRILAS